MAHPGGRPTIYTPELADRICEIVATNPVGLPTLCQMFPEIPSYETINVWRWKRKEFSDKYTQAKRFQAEMMAESIEDVSKDLYNTRFPDENGVMRIDPGHVAHARLVTDSRKWTACKLAPKIYGERMQNDVTINHEADLKDLA